MPVKMQLARIIISELTENQVIYLQEEDGDREFPILIGIFEATNIDRRVKEEYHPPRPLTHDLIVRVADSLGAKIESVVITDLNDHTYFAQLNLRKQDGEVITIDSRPSDAIAVAVTFTPALPIYVSEKVLEEATSTPF
ncbi:protein containing DUF151 [Rhodopirellula maiorica SM1]|uniref:Protein containing DUF151 n=3 Tax=Novipirellula TaxID=2795426 RepID=M5S8V6_9BACT|nr:bifunctional nuclease family protein [Rhodopirellula maiorica]EMI22604.1 protein containing DUF151 [Rhodopirellula maiorica SM1]|tara:strand:- start:2297 stop:2713 length:417 start_codon:yes stop_codon:yes gene_type:complete